MYIHINQFSSGCLSLLKKLLLNLALLVPSATERCASGHA